jgi:hypothetical protein
MTPVRAAFLDAADCTAGLLAEPLVAARWDDPSALAEMTVSAVAGHLARQVLLVDRVLSQPPGPEPPISLLEHYSRAAWVEADRGDEANVSIRRDSAAEAEGGPGDLSARTTQAARELRSRLPAEPEDRVVFLPWGPWSLTLDDMLATRILEIVVHCDDLTTSVGLREVQIPPDAADIATSLLTQLAVRRHGLAPVVRTLSRTERAPGSISAF